MKPYTSLFIFYLISAFYAKAQYLRQEYAINKDLIGCYPFDGSAKNKISNNKNFTVSGAILSKDRFGNNTNSYYFDGIDDYLEVDLGTYTGLSVSFWFNPKNINNWYPQLLNYSNTNFYCHLLGTIYTISERGKLFFRTNQVLPSSLYSKNNTIYNTWYHVVCILDDIKKIEYLYLDGVCQDSITIKSGINVISSFLHLGAQHPNYPERFRTFFNGDIDDVRIYSRGLCKYEVEYLYKNNVSCSDNVDVSCTNLSNQSSTTPSGSNTTTTSPVSPTFTVIGNNITTPANTSTGQNTNSIVGLNNTMPQEEKKNIAEIFHKIDSCIIGKIPNIITPNNDGENDFFELPSCIAIYLPQLFVYNRYGNKVYEAINYSNTWTGSGLADGIYYYFINFEAISTYKGWLMINR
ncbi:MAG: LamG-like jellyroll fold domain-containing protein [Cytophagales bacterium]|nr:LamG-like jellyroll fold domain-containing protein [Cytophagales bacterium]